MDEVFDNITFHSQSELLGFLNHSYLAHLSTISALREDNARLERLRTPRAADLAMCSELIHSVRKAEGDSFCKTCGQPLSR